MKLDQWLNPTCVFSLFVISAFFSYGGWVGNEVGGVLVYLGALVYLF